MKVATGSVLIAASVLTTLLAVSSDAPGAEDDEKAKAVMERVIGFYGEVDTVAVDATLSVTETKAGKKDTAETGLAIAMDRPNKISMVAESEDDALTAVSDGETLTIYVPKDKKYVVREAPGDAAEVLGLVGKGAGQVGAMILAEPFRAEPYGLLMDSIIEQQYLGEEEVDGRPCDHVKLVHPAVDVEMWVDTGAEPLIQKVDVDLARLLEQRGMQDRQVAIAISYANWRINKELPADTFSFTPPEGVAKIVVKRPPGGPRGLLGKPAPRFALRLLGGGTMDLAEHKGKHIVILDFWASWCGPCRLALPVYAKAAEAYKAKGVVFYAVNLGEEEEQIKKFLDKEKLECTVALDSDGTASDQYGVQSIPHSVIIDKDGTVQAVHTGLAPDLERKLKKELDALVAGQKLAK